MKIKKIISLVLLTVFVLSAAQVCNAAYETQVNDVQAICDIAVEYVNSGSKDDFKQYMSNGIKDKVTFESGKFEYLYEQNSDFSDNKNQLTKMISVIGDIYVNGGNSKITQSDINQNVTPGYGADSGIGNDYQDDDAEKFMQVINDTKSKLTKKNTASSASDKKASDSKDVLPEKNSSKKASDTASDNSSSSGMSVGGSILIALIISIIVFAAGTYALQQVAAKNKEKAVKNIDDDDIFNLRLAVKSMQSSIQKADGNFKELDKLRIQVDEIDEKLEHISDYLRKLNKSE